MMYVVELSATQVRRGATGHLRGLPQRLYLANPEKPDTWVDISDTIDTKIAALRQHKSQLGDWDPEEMVKKWAEEDGKNANLPYAEAYKVMMLVMEEEKPEN